jgi:hypothetical protein
MYHILDAIRFVKPIIGSQMIEMISMYWKKVVVLDELLPLGTTTSSLHFIISSLTSSYSLLREMAAALKDHPSLHLLCI